MGMKIFLLVVLYSLMVNGDLDPVVMKLKEDFEELKATMVALKAENDELKDTVDELKSENAEQAEDISFLRNPPFYHLSVYQDLTTVISSVITFDKELYMESNFCVDADFNLNTGVYTNGWPGTYTVSWNSWVHADLYNPTIIYLRKNGQIINEAIQVSYFFNDNGYMYEQGGRTMLIRMLAGDTLSLYCDNCFNGVHDITFTISLSTFDVL